MPSVAFIFTIVLAALFGVSAEASSPRVRDVALAGSDARPATPALLRGGIDAAKALPMDVETGLEKNSPITSDDGEADGDVFAVTAEGSATCEFYGSMPNIRKCAAAAARMNLKFSSESAPPELSLPRGCACRAHGPDRGCWFEDRDDGTTDSTVFLICEVSGDFNDAGAIAAADAAIATKADADADANAAYTAARAAFNTAIDAATAAYDAAIAAATTAAVEPIAAAYADAAAASAAVAAKDHGYLVFPAATLVDPSGLDARTTFVSFGPGHCRDARGRHYVATLPEVTVPDPEACGRHCLENIDVVDVVGFAWADQNTVSYCECYFGETMSGGNGYDMDRSCEWGAVHQGEGCGTGPMGSPSGAPGVKCFERRYTP